MPQAKWQQEHVTRHRPTTPGLCQGDQASPLGGVAILRAADSRALGDAAPQGSPHAKRLLESFPPLAEAAEALPLTCPIVTDCRYPPYAALV